MSKNNIIDFIINILKKYPNVQFERLEANGLEISTNTETGFPIYLGMGPREYDLHFGSFHWHFDKTEEETGELLEQFFAALTGVARIAEYKKAGRIYKSKLQIKDRDGNWHNHGTTGFFNLNFWNKTEINYLMNESIPMKIYDSFDSFEFPKFENAP